MDGSPGTSTLSTKYCTLTAPLRVRRVAQFGDRGQRGEAVAGQVDLRDELDAELGRPPDPAADVVGR